ncbi:L-fucose mutarotase [Clostridium fallax]|uniref:L-fucose mutarotase n=1 Tax=Clostridium fallax TaxID=1533 RepID=A0A1M4XDK1_9CLOT|nr:L-fucose mutarotase [Clostridium fallax]SHE91450.1 L-fucose mutarotase [Clostridium fallax]SQB05969.1 RbsD or FucU transport protein [Clostridium fallax]
MLKNIPSIISPELLKILMEMGHGDEIVIGDGNFPSASCSRNLIRADGHNIPDLLNAILSLMPLDTYCDSPVTLMKVVDDDSINPIIWNDYRKIIKENFPSFKDFYEIERFDFYEKAKKCYAVIATSEKALYGNIILKKGVV